MLPKFVFSKILIINLHYIYSKTDCFCLLVKIPLKFHGGILKFFSIAMICIDYISIKLLLRIKEFVRSYGVHIP
jgi:hypothetical protein